MRGAVHVNNQVTAPFLLRFEHGSLRLEVGRQEGEKVMYTVE